MSVLELKKKAVHPFARRFFAGETHEDALARVREANALGMGVTLDFLGEDVTSQSEVKAAVEEYRRVLKAVSEEGLDCSLAIKLSHVGLGINIDMAASSALDIAEAASEKGITLWVDMEGSEHTDATIDIYRMLRKLHPGAGLALQAMLHRTWDDLRSLADEGALIRLVKGAYDEPDGIAENDGARLRERYMEMMDYLFSVCGRFAIGTHDKNIISAAMGATNNLSCSVEFQMLMGVRDDVKAMLVEKGRRVVEYVPYGTDWYGYGMRRLMEKKRNVAYFAGGLFGR